MPNLLATPWAGLSGLATGRAPVVTCYPPLAAVPLAGAASDPGQVASYALGVPWVEAARSLVCCPPAVDALPVLETAVAVPRPRPAAEVAVPVP